MGLVNRSRQFTLVHKLYVMKLVGLFLCGVAIAAATKMDKCKMIPKGGKRKTGNMKNVNQGFSESPAAINFLIDNKAELMDLFKAGKMQPTNELISQKLALAAMFSNGVGDQQLGQIFRQVKATINNKIKVTQEELNKNEDLKQYASMFRDNSQRISHLVRDIVYSNNILYNLSINTDTTEDIYAAMNADVLGEGMKAYKVFLDNHLPTLMPFVKEIYDELKSLHDSTVLYVAKVLKDEKAKSAYRQLIGELPQVYQFFNDNIDYIELSNVDKDLEEALGKEILLELAKNSDIPQIKSMINRHAKFIKKIMKDRAMQQQKEKVVAEVTDKNKELKENAENQEEFDRIVKEKMDAGETLTKEMKQAIWQDVISKEKDSQKEEISNQQQQGQKGKKGLSRYEHIVAILSLMPDDLKETIAAMVEASCPELDLMQIESEEMKQVVAEQPVNFIDQLIKELHDVCDMFGLIDPNKITTVNINGIDVDFYAGDWHQGEKVEW